MPSYAPISLTASATLTPYHAGTTITLNAAAGLTVTLPSAVGSGRIYSFVVGTTVTSNNYVIQVTTTDIMTGNVILAQDAGDTLVMFETASDSDTITMNGSTKGGLRGDRITLTDMASGVWGLAMVGAATGVEATPLSAAVS
jgi:hypothetical protein